MGDPVDSIQKLFDTNQKAPSERDPLVGSARSSEYPPSGANRYQQADCSSSPCFTDPSSSRKSGKAHNDVGLKSL